MTVNPSCSNFFSEQFLNPKNVAKKKNRTYDDEATFEIRFCHVSHCLLS